MASDHADALCEALLLVEVALSDLKEEGGHLLSLGREAFKVCLDIGLGAAREAFVPVGLSPRRRRHEMIYQLTLLVFGFCLVTVSFMLNKTLGLFTAGTRLIYSKMWSLPFYENEKQCSVGAC